ncbi:unnamed protein product, partial [Phaeothamnion confervicola]
VASTHLFCIQRYLGGELPAAPLQAMNRNARKPKAANHGKRPVCRHGRRKKNAIVRGR